MPDCSPSSTAFAGRAVYGPVFIGVPAMAVSHGLRIPALFPPRHCEPTGRREAPPDDRLREAIHGTASGDMDCFVASLLAMTADIYLCLLAAPIARGLHFLCPPRIQRAQGRPGARCTRDLVCNCAQKTRTRAYRYRRNTPAFPAQWLYGLLRALPGERLFCHRRLREASLLSDLMPAPRHQDHTTSPYASGASVLRALRVHRISPHVRDDREPPLDWVRRTELCG
jgi:hypothetical protein